MNQFAAQLPQVQRALEDHFKEQLKPIKAELAEQSRSLSRFDRWKLSLWSNGSGGPPGWLEITFEKFEDNFKSMFAEIKELRDSSLLQNGERTSLERKVKDDREKSTMRIAILGLIIAFIMMILGLVSAFVAAKIQTGQITVPQIKEFMDSPMTKVYADTVSPTTADTPTIPMR